MKLENALSILQSAIDDNNYIHNQFESISRKAYEDNEECRDAIDSNIRDLMTLLENNPQIFEQ